MPQYQYKARDKNGVVQTGTMEARSRDAVADQLSGKGFIPVLIDEQVQAWQLPDLFSGFSRVKSQDLIVFSRQLATLVSAGVPFLQSLGTIERQTGNPHLKNAVTEIRHSIESGTSFSEALSRHPHIFNRLYVSMIKAGETAGILDSVLERLALLAER